MDMFSNTVNCRGYVSADDRVIYDSHTQVLRHVETVVELRGENVDAYIEARLDTEMLEDRAGSATYKEIQAYIEDKYGLKVSNLYIGRMKDKVGIKERENYNHGSGVGRVPECPPEKKEAIMDAFRHFGMV